MKALSDTIDLGFHPRDYLADGLVQGWYFIRWGGEFSRADLSIRYDSEDSAMVAFNTHSISWAGSESTAVVKITFRPNWGGGGNIIQVLTAIRNLKHLGVVDVELTRADLGQEPIKVLTNKVSYEQDDSDDGDDFGTDAFEELPDDTEHELADFYGNPYGRPE